MANIDTNMNNSAAEVASDVAKSEPVPEPVSEIDELAKLRAEMAKQKAALDKATKEAAESKRALRARQSAEEIAAEEKRLADEAMEKELNELRKQISTAKISQKVMSFVGDEKASSSIADYLFGASDVDAALDELHKAWVAKEKKLRAEFGRITAPSGGGTDGSSMTKEKVDGMTFAERVKFANEHPEEYNKLMGR